MGHNVMQTTGSKERTDSTPSASHPEGGDVRGKTNKQEEEPGFPWAPLGGEQYIGSKYFEWEDGRTNRPSEAELDQLRSAAHIARLAMERAQHAVQGHETPTPVGLWSDSTTKLVHDLAVAAILEEEAARLARTDQSDRPDSGSDI
jgi:hypothetical protein